jgi:hypothetical protein
MKRLPTLFYRDLKDLRDEWGDVEYDRHDLAKAARPLLDKHLALGSDAGDILKDDLIIQILEAIEGRENDPKQGNLFSYDAHVPLGPNKRVKRGRMNLAQLERRKKVIDGNMEAQVKAYSLETAWITPRINLLRGRPASAVVDDVISEDGGSKDKRPSPRPAPLDDLPLPP